MNTDNGGYISRAEAVQLLQDKAIGYTVSMFATSVDCYIARTVAMECAAEIKYMPEPGGRPWSHLGGDEWCCPSCGWVIHTEGSWVEPDDHFCRHCGQKMSAAEE